MNEHIYARAHAYAIESSIHSEFIIISDLKEKALKKSQTDCILLPHAANAVFTFERTSIKLTRDQCV